MVPVVDIARRYIAEVCGVSSPSTCPWNALHQPISQMALGVVGMFTGQNGFDWGAYLSTSPPQAHVYAVREFIHAQTQVENFKRKERKRKNA